MKKFFLIIIIFQISTLMLPVFAVDSTPSSASQSAKAQDLLDRVATKVAALVDAKKRTFQGQIKSVGSSSYVITTSEGDKTIVTNDATEFYRIKGGKKIETDFSGIKKADDVGAIGTIDPSNGSMTAKQIIAKIARKIFVGPIEATSGSTVTIDGTKIDLSDANLSQLDKAAGKITVAKISDFKQGKTAFVLAHSPENGTYSSLKALVIN